jgi:hypothetical protein
MLTPTPLIVPTTTPSSGRNGTIEISDDEVPANQQVQVTVTIHDVAGNVVRGLTCRFSVATQPGTDARLLASSSVTNDDGQALVPLDAGSTTGTVRVAAVCGEITLETSVRVVASPPGSLPNAGGGSGRPGKADLPALALSLALALIGIAGYRLRRARRAS